MHKVILIWPWKRRGQYGTWSARWGRGKGHTQLRLWVQTQSGFMEQPKYNYDPISHGRKTGEKWVWQSRFEPGFEGSRMWGQRDWPLANWKWRANKRFLIKGIRWSICGPCCCWFSLTVDLCALLSPCAIRRFCPFLIVCCFKEVSQSRALGQLITQFF